jgi:SpoVK/Ycf46/Vps4 family AAA+-type ATPase
MHYLVLIHCDPGFCEERSIFDDVAEVTAFLELGPEACFRLSNPSLPIRQEALLNLDRGLSSNLLRFDIKIDTGVAKSLRGLELTHDDVCTIQSSALRDVLAQEPDLEALVRESAVENVTDLTAAPDDTFEDLDRDPDADLDDEHDILSLLTESEVPPPELAEAPQTDDPEAIQPYTSNLQYLQDKLEYFEARHQWRKLTMDDDPFPSRGDDNMSTPARIRAYRAREQQVQNRIERRLELTRQAGSWLPRAERLATQLKLCPFERDLLTLLAGAARSLDFRKRLGSPSYMRADVGEIIYLFFEDMPQQIEAPKFFQKDAPLIAEHLLTLSGAAFGGDILSADIEIDQRMVDYLLGQEPDLSTVVEGSHLYTPDVSLEQVVIPERDRDLILSTVKSYPAFKRQRRATGLDRIVSYGNGMVFLLSGPSGTGKTMFANALANHLGKRLLLVNFPQLGYNNSDEAYKFLVREARIHDAILFFDECEQIFEDRALNPGISLILSEIERHDGIVVLATNRPQKLDEAMHRRITLAVNFRLPDASQREQIWRNHIPPNMHFSAQPDFAELAHRFELSGGQIKNAVIAALAIATGRDTSAPKVSPEDLEQGARLQLKSDLQLSSFDDRVVPTRGIDHLVLPETLLRNLKDLINLEKARRSLVVEWGFAGNGFHSLGSSALFHGPPGTGKSLAAEAVAFELGRPLKRVNAARVASKWVGEGAKNIEALFRDARDHQAVLVFDEADTFFAGRTAVASATDRYANLEVNVLLHEMERFSGAVILTTNLSENIDPAFRRRIRFSLGFPRPDTAHRVSLWRQHIPEEAPLAPDVDIEALARAFQITGAQIRDAVFKAATRAILRAGDDKRLTQDDLLQAAGEERASDEQGPTPGFF